MSRAFLDTSYALVLELANDQNHRPAVEHWQEFAQTPPTLVTTSFVLSEVVTFFNSRGHHAKAVQIGERLLNSTLIRLIHVNEPLFMDGWSYLKQHQDKNYSLTDCISFLVMKREAIADAVTFDRHFVQAGFQVLPR